MVKGDKERYFRLPEEDVKTRLRVKGEYLRTLYFLRRIGKEKKRESRENKEGKVDTKVAGRYG